MRPRSGRRPITDDEWPALVALGAAIRSARTRVGLSREQLGRAAQLTAGSIGDKERGDRRSPRSTLARIAVALVDACPELGPADRLTDHWCVLAGPGLAPESEYAARVARRRDRRYRSIENKEAHAARARERHGPGPRALVRQAAAAARADDLDAFAALLDQIGTP